MPSYFEIFNLFLFYIYGYFSCLYVCVAHVCSTHRVQKRAVGLMELELQIASMLDVGAVNQTWVFCKNK